MVSYISASYVYPIIAAPLKDGVVAVDAEGTIKGVYSAHEAKNMHITDVEYHEGLLVPGFINSHCHLELSSLKGKIPRGTGLPEFAKAVIRLRSSDEYELSSAMLKADSEMYENGIVAVGDISNQWISKSLKSNSSVYYFTFLEVIGFKPEAAAGVMEKARKIKAEFHPLPVSIVPHAPYSVSTELFKELNEFAHFQDGPVSIHNQETADENVFFEQKKGGFLSLFDFLGQDIEFFKPSGKTSLQTFLPLMSPGLKTLLVHNTYTSATDLTYAAEIHANLYWCLCPNANLYIENKLPDVNSLRNADLTITLGTDSLASNEGLSILSEMNLLQESFDVPVEELLKWASFNGAEFLGIADRFGSFEVGKRPGINLIDFTFGKGKVILGNAVKRIY